MVAEIAPGPAISGMASGKTAMLRMRSACATSALFSFRSVPPLEDHLEGDEEEQHAAGDAEGGMVMPKTERMTRPATAKRTSTAERGKGGAERDLRSLSAAHAGGQREEEWRQAQRVYSDEERHEGGEGLFEHGETDRFPARRRWRAQSEAAVSADASAESPTPRADCARSAAAGSSCRGRRGGWRRTG